MKNGGPAFPMQFLGISRGQLSYEDTDNQEGMTLRDYFAAAAMSAIVGESSVVNEIGKRWPDELPQRISIAAFKIADAMLGARDK